MFNFFGFSNADSYGHSDDYSSTSLVFESQYFVNSTSNVGKNVLEGDKIFLPPSALDRLARMNVDYPLLFEITNEENGKVSHCGVLEFSSEEGYCYLPPWMMKNLSVSLFLCFFFFFAIYIKIFIFILIFSIFFQLEDGNLLKVKNVSLPKASFLKIRPQSCDFLNVSNPRALLEVSLRKFTCLTVGDIFTIKYLNKFLSFEVCEVKPSHAVSIIETDCNVEFDEPVGYQEYLRANAATTSAATSHSYTPQIRELQKSKKTLDNESQQKNTPFNGTSKRLDGKPTGPSDSKESSPAPAPTTSRPSSAAFPTYSGRTIASSSSTSSTSSSSTNNLQYQSIIGDKFSKRKSAYSLK